MAKTRLTTPHRRAIRDRLLEKWMNGPEEAALHDGYRQLAQAAYDQLYPATVQLQMAVLPEGWLPKRSEFTVQFGRGSEGYVCLYFNGRLPHSSGCKCIAQVIPPSVDRQFL